MNRHALLLLLTVFYLFTFESSFAGLELEGRYRGYLLPDKKLVKIPLQLDFFKVGPGIFSAVLKLSFGHFDSHEYVSQYYRDVVCVDHCGEIILNGDDWDLSLFELVIHKKEMRGKFRSHSGYAKGRVLLKKLPEKKVGYVNSPFVELDRLAELLERKTFPLISGQYVGECSDGNKYLQIEASKWYSIFEPGQTPFYGYRFTGRIGKADGSCGGEDVFCLENNFYDGTFNPYTGSLKMTGYPKNVRLSLDGDFAYLNGCKLKKEKDLDIAYVPAGEFLNPIMEKIATWKQAENKSEELISSDLDGYYKGFLFHTQLNRYQVMDASVESIRQASDANRIQFYPSAWLHFDHPQDSGEFKISFPFKKVIFDPEVPYMIWDSGADAIAKIDCWQKNLIMGQWISRTFGVVGPFVLSRHGTLPPFKIKGSKLKSGLGLYKSEHWSLELFGLEDRNPVDLASFFPIQIYGGAQIPRVTEMKTVDAGVYDFYSGSIAFRLSDTRVVTGSVNGEDLRLFWPSNPRWGVKMLPMTLQLFKHVGDTSL